MDRRSINEIPEHDQLILMMAQHFKQLGYSNIKADITGWTRPGSIYWTNNPEKTYVPDLTANDVSGIFVILEAETCSTLNDEHTKEQFEIFRAHANNIKGRFEVVVPKTCSGVGGTQLIQQYCKEWGFILDNTWTPA